MMDIIQTVRSLISLSNGRLASQSIDAVIVWNLDDSTVAHKVTRKDADTEFKSLLLLPNGHLLATNRTIEITFSQIFSFL